MRIMVALTQTHVEDLVSYGALVPTSPDEVNTPREFVRNFFQIEILFFYLSQGWYDLNNKTA